MPTRYNHGSHYQNHRRGAELHDIAAHAHRTAAEAHEKQDHQTGQERTRQALEHSQQAYRHTEQIHRDGANERRIATFGHKKSPNWRIRYGRPEAVRKARRKRIGSMPNTN